MDLKNQNWFKYAMVAAASSLVTVILLTVFVLIRLDSTLWQQYGWIDSIRLIYDDFYSQGHIYWMVKGAVAVIFIALLFTILIWIYHAILLNYEESIRDKKGELEVEKKKVDIMKRELDIVNRELEAKEREIEQKKWHQANHLKGIEAKQKKMEERLARLRGKIKLVIEVLEDEQPNIKKAKALLKRARNAKN